MKVLLVAATLLFIFLGAVSFYKSWKSDQADDSYIETTESETYDIFKNVEDKVNDGSDKESVNDEIQTAIDYTEIDEALEVPLERQNEVDLPQKKKENPKEVNSPKKQIANDSVKATGTSVESGKYMVLAGSYLVKENAEKMITKLKALGYPDARILQFENKSYHTVCAYRSDVYESAISQVNALKRKGVESYVRTKK